MSRIIKAGAGAEAPRTIVAAPVYDAKLAADQLLAEAQATAERILAEAHADAERALRKAETEGRERGLGAVTELLAGARAAAARARTESELELRILAVRIAEKLLLRELELRPEAIVDIALGALRHAGAPRELVLRCAPDDLEALERGKPRLLERCKQAHAVAFRADAEVERGGCVIETELGVVDARLSTQLEAIERALKESL